MTGYRTILANVMFSIIPILELTEFRDVIPNQYLPWYSLGMVLANMGLRYITTTPVGGTK